MSATRRRGKLLVHAMCATAAAMTLTSCSYTPEQIACMHARNRAEHHGVVSGVGAAVVLVLFAVTVYVRRRPTPMASPRRTVMAALLTVAAVVPIAVLFAILGSSWAGRTYHCGDGEDFPLGLLIFLAIFPAAITLPSTAALLLWARRVWHGARSSRA